MKWSGNRISDNWTSKLGRRRPFIIIGTILSAFGMLLMGHSQNFGELLGDSNENELHIRGLFIAFIGAVCGAMGCSFLNVTGKALISDIIPVAEQHPVQLIGIMMQT